MDALILFCKLNVRLSGLLLILPELWIQARTSRCAEVLSDIGRQSLPICVIPNRPAHVSGLTAMKVASTFHPSEALPIRKRSPSYFLATGMKHSATPMLIVARKNLA